MRRTTKLRHVGLGVKLRELRLANEMTTRSVAAALGISPSSVNRTELGKRPPERDELNALCALYRVTGDQKIELMQRGANGDDSPLWLEMAYGEATHLTALLTLERDAAIITNVESAVIPGLAQTSEYSRQLITMSTVVDYESPEKRVATRLSRQAVLSRPDSPDVRFFVDEGALYRTLGDPWILLEQLEYLLVIERRNNVTFRVLPFSAPAHIALDGSFAMFELPDGTTHVLVETHSFGVFLTESPDIAPYVESRRVLDQHALDESASRQVVRVAMDRMRRSVSG